MENQISKQSEDRWINERLASLSPPANWQPHADRAFERVMQRLSSGNRQKWIRFSMAGAALAAVGIVVAVLPWNALRAPKPATPINKTLPVETRQESVAAFAAEINVTPAQRVPETHWSSPLPPTEDLVFKPIPPLPELPRTETEFSRQEFGRKKGAQAPRGVLAEAAAGGPQESPQSGATQPVVISQVRPVYTEEAKQAKVTGVVELVCTIHTDGSVTVERIARGLGYGLDESAQEALMQWRFIPGKKDGVPVTTVVNIVVNFGLK